MKIIPTTPNPSGAYPPIQDGNFSAVPEGMAVWPDSLDTADFYAHNGFVTLTVEQVDGCLLYTSFAPGGHLGRDGAGVHPVLVGEREAGFPPD